MSLFAPKCVCYAGFRGEKKKGVAAAAVSPLGNLRNGGRSEGRWRQHSKKRKRGIDIGRTSSLNLTRVLHCTKIRDKRG